MARLGVQVNTVPVYIVIASGLAGLVGGLVTARYTWNKDRRESAQTDIDKAQADDKATDRVIDLLTQANELAIQNERMKYEQKLREEIGKMSRAHRKSLDDMRVSIAAETQRAIREALDVYGCENAAQGCPTRTPRIYAVAMDISPGGTD